MPRTSPVRPRWTIGQFSRMTRLSARMLRHYDRLGLLRPGGVDPFNGYRYYSRAELEPAVMLRRLREAGLGLEEISRALPAHLGDDEETWRRVLDEHLARLEDEATALELQRERTLALLDHREDPTMSAMNPANPANPANPEPVRITTLTIPAHTVIARREIIPTYDHEGALFDEFEPQVSQALATGGARLTGQPCGATFFEEGHVEHDVDIEVWEVVDAPVEVSAPLTCRTVADQSVIAAEHVGPYKGLSQTYTTLLREIGERGMTVSGPAFERYLVGPFHESDPAAWRTQVCFPIDSTGSDAGPAPEPATGPDAGSDAASGPTPV